MTPDEYIKIQEHIISKHYKERYDPAQIFWAGVNRQYVEHLKTEIKGGKPMSRFVIEFGRNGDIMNHQEGRHRIIAMKELKIKKVPVILAKRRF